MSRTTLIILVASLLLFSLVSARLIEDAHTNPPGGSTQLPERYDLCGLVNDTTLRANCAGSNLSYPYETNSQGLLNSTSFFVSSDGRPGVFFANFSVTGDIQTVVAPESLVSGLWVHYDWDYVVDNANFYSGNVPGLVKAATALPAIGGAYELYSYSPANDTTMSWTTDTVFMF